MVGEGRGRREKMRGGGGGGTRGFRRRYWRKNKTMKEINAAEKNKKK